jgi:hypothetical protein
MTQTKAWIVFGMVAACGHSEPGKDWSGVALDTTVTGTFPKAAFELKLPSGWKAETVGIDAEVSKEWRPDVKDYFSEPTVSVSYEAIPAKSLDAFIAEEFTDPKLTVEHKEMNGDYFIASAHSKDNGQVWVKLSRQKGDANLICSAAQAKSGGVPNPAATIAWLEKLCQTLTIK